MSLPKSASTISAGRAQFGTRDGDGVNRQPLYFILEIVLALVLHPLAVIGAWYDLWNRHDMSAGKRALWAVIVLVWGIGPILYVILEHGKVMPWGNRPDQAL